MESSTVEIIHLAFTIQLRVPEESFHKELVSIVNTSLAIENSIRDNTFVRVVTPTEFTDLAAVLRRRG